MKLLFYIIVLISILYQQVSSYTCYSHRDKKIDLMKTVPDIANNLDPQEVMNFQKHQYRWSPNFQPSDNIAIRFQFQRTGNANSSIMFIPDYAYDYFQLTLKRRTMEVKVVSSNYDIYVQEFPISSAVDKRFVWFAFAFYRDHVEVYYDRKFVGKFQANIRLQMFNNLNYSINSYNNYNGNPVRGYMARFQLFPDVNPLNFMWNCIGSGYPIYYTDRSNKFLRQEFDIIEDNTEEEIDNKEI